MKYAFYLDAELELNTSVDYFEVRKEEFGVEFIYEVQKTIQRILEFPSLHTIRQVQQKLWCCNG